MRKTIEKGEKFEKEKYIKKKGKSQGQHDMVVFIYGCWCWLKCRRVNEGRKTGTRHLFALMPLGFHSHFSKLYTFSILPQYIILFLPKSISLQFATAKSFF